MGAHYDFAAAGKHVRALNAFVRAGNGLMEAGWAFHTLGRPVRAVMVNLTRSAENLTYPEARRAGDELFQPRTADVRFEKRVDRCIFGYNYGEYHTDYRVIVHHNNASAQACADFTRRLHEKLILSLHEFIPS